LEAVGQDFSPQSLAVGWLASNHDLRAFSNSRIIQRYALATFYYATEGETSWMEDEGWLSPEVHECQWYSGLMEDGEDPCVNGNFAYLVLGENGLRGAIAPDVALISTLGKGNPADLFLEKDLQLTLTTYLH
jgi:hypothetical protein